MLKFTILLSLISLISADTSVTVYPTKSINDVSEKFISHEIDFYDLMEYRGNLALVTPSYLKLKNFLNYMKKFDQHDFNGAGVSNIFKSFYRNKITPVIVIDYNITNFEPITLLEDLRRAKDLNVKECIWQLGESTMEFNYSGLKKYTEDLKTLQILCESVRKNNKFSWKVAAVSTFIDDFVPFDIEGYDFGRFTNDEILAKSTIKQRTGYNVWMTVKSNSTASDGNYPESCDENCLINGLSYAQILGETAKKGADVIFIESQDISSLNANSFKQAIDKMHNALIGTRVFKVRNSKSSYDKKQSSVYAYCSKKMNGGVTLMGINYSNARERISSKLSTAIIGSSSIVLQYILNIADGHVMVNNERYNGTITPVYKYKKSTKIATDFTIPPYSIAFWVLKDANEKECLKSEEKNKVRTRSIVTSSSDDLLKTLAANALKRETEMNHRNKRQISNSSPLLPKFDLNFPNIVQSNINQRSIKDVFFNNVNAEVYKVAPIESNPLQSSENPTLPSGDVYLMVDDGVMNDYVDAEIQYPNANMNSQKHQQPKSNKKLYRENSVHKMEIPNEYLSSHDYIESSYKTSKKSQKTKKPVQKQADELFESENFHTENPKNQDQMKTSNNNVELKTIARELEPTYRQSKKAIIAAKRKWDQNQLLELLKDATLQEVDKSQIRDANEFQIIDLSNNEEIPVDYDEYEDTDEDGFFSSDNHKKLRTRRDVDYRKNEISRSENFLGESDEDNMSKSIEDVHLYLHPRSQDMKLQQSSTTTTEKTVNVDENSPLAVKLIDVFSKSLDDIIVTVHKNFISWWYVFSPSTEE